MNDQPIDGKVDRGPEKPRVQSVARAASIILAVANSSNGLNVADIRRQLGLPQQATYHLLHTLRETGLLRKNEQGLFTLGIKAGVIADGFSRQFSVPDHLRNLVRELAQRTGETSYASRWQDKDVVSFAFEPGTRAIQASAQVSIRGGDLHARASAKLLMSYLPPSELDPIVEGIDFRKRTERTITNKEELLKDLEEIRTKGYALDEEEYADDLCCIAVPVNLAGENFAICTSMPAHRFQDSYKKNLDEMFDCCQQNAN
ncbi:IclR family transcriptional regulator [Oceanibium sediminis]|uniref:IclR family transcriptional regulator n=1 Tax=Oceanibium sediminis TaxID=2026339 RepID=UPI000DD38F60|nr:IclR family transcriptional regulator [Oceanibium sediminis]